MEQSEIPSIDFLSSEGHNQLLALLRDGGLLAPESRLRPEQVNRITDSLQSIGEADIATDRDALCPICLNTLLSVLAEEETARALDSPAHPIEECGIVKLRETCGHIFCRRDMLNWLRNGNGSCPTCRRPLLDELHNAQETDQVQQQPDISGFEQHLRDLFSARGSARLPSGFMLPPWLSSNNSHPEDDRSPYAGMYS